MCRSSIALCEHAGQSAIARTTMQLDGFYIWQNWTVTAVRVLTGFILFPSPVRPLATRVRNPRMQRTG